MAHLEPHVFKEIRDRLKDLDVKVVFDVGANVGQSSTRFRAELPEAEIWAFEPVAATHNVLAAKFESDDKFRSFQVAFGASANQATMLANGTSVGNRIIPNERDDLSTETVEVMRGDEFLEQHGIARVNYLKIDAEGHDIHVLQGFRRALSDHSIDLVQVEAGLNPRNGGHITFEKFKAMLEAFDYSLFAVTDVTFETRGRPMLRRWDAVFISQKTIEENTVSSP